MNVAVESAVLLPFGNTIRLHSIMLFVGVRAVSVRIGAVGTVVGAVTVDRATHHRKDPALDPADLTRWHFETVAAN